MNEWRALTFEQKQAYNEAMFQQRTAEIERQSARIQKSVRTSNVVTNVAVQVFEDQQRLYMEQIERMLSEF